MADPAITYNIKGLKETTKALRDLAPSVRKQIRKRLKSSVIPVAAAVRNQIRQKFSGSDSVRDPHRGRMAKSVRATASLSQAKVSVGARADVPKRTYAYWGGRPTRHNWGNRGYRYPRRFEFDPAYSDKRFMQPAFDATKDQAVAEFMRAMDEIAAEFIK